MPTYRCNTEQRAFSRPDTAQRHADENPTHQVIMRYSGGSKEVMEPRRREQPTCVLCGAEVDCTPGNYLVAYAQGSGPRHGSKNYFCGPCANWMA